MGVKIEEETTENNRNNVAINLYMLTWNDLKVKFFKGECRILHSFGVCTNSYLE